MTAIPVSPLLLARQLVLPLLSKIASSHPDFDSSMLDAINSDYSFALYGPLLAGDNFQQLLTRFKQATIQQPGTVGALAYKPFGRKFLQDAVQLWHRKYPTVHEGSYGYSLYLVFAEDLQRNILNSEEFTAINQVTANLQGSWLSYLHRADDSGIEPYAQLWYLVAAVLRIAIYPNICALQPHEYLFDFADDEVQWLKEVFAWFRRVMVVPELVD